jgi:hypothetical protein
MKRLTDNELEALEAALAKSTPGEARLLPNGGAMMDEDPTYWGVLGGKGYYDGAGSGGFNLTGFIDEADAQRLVVSYTALPALIAELRELRARTAPEPISDKHRDGNWWLVWDPGSEQWMKCRFECLQWNKSGTMREPFFGTPTHALPMPPAPEGEL